MVELGTGHFNSTNENFQLGEGELFLGKPQLI